MQYNQLGTTGTFVSRLCLGTMTFGGTANPIGNLSLGEAGRIVGVALDAGINFIDTADVYTGGGSEALLGDILKDRRDEVVLASKVSSRVGKGPNDVGQSRIHIMQALEKSLTRLKTDHIDLYQVHNFDGLTPMDEMLEVLDDVVRQGKVRYIGCSNYAAWQMTKALGISERRLLSRFVSVQSYYSLAGRDIERELVPAVIDQGLGLLCWSPLAGGLLSGKFDRDGAVDKDSRRANLQFPPVDENRIFDIIDVLKAIAGERECTPAQVAIAWLLSRPAVTSVIVGVKRSDQLADNLGAIDVVLSDEEIGRLEASNKLAPAYPGWIQTYRASSRVPSGHSVKGASWMPGEQPI
ncbi:aldo/keto reductase [Rhizobium sp. P44RR-XXIV]|uniref:aldo/keto reductase n=1 Tax=Rhizobium sp. P44RR-XXIV TaxID=1921145 RepID=UPI0009867AAE|nr:aldo/keto reductase [Rhizobium sp. P44RR-XXIV]TIX90494.1 aldo/keto reductase [Rhizobium sp. P44RR-XXIV]